MNRRWAAAALWLTAAAPHVEGAWVRASLPHQDETAAYCTITTDAADALIGVDTPAAGAAMLHASVTHGSMSGMADVDRVALPAGVPVSLAPRGTHVMLMDMRTPLREGMTVTLTLRFAHAAPLTIAAPVRRTAP